MGVDKFWLEERNGVLFVHGSLGGIEIQGANGCARVWHNDGCDEAMATGALLGNLPNISGRIRQELRRSGR